MENSPFPPSASGIDALVEALFAEREADEERGPADGPEAPAEQRINVLAALEDEGDPAAHGVERTLEGGERAPWLESEFLSWAQRISGDLGFADSVERDLRLVTPLGQ